MEDKSICDIVREAEQNYITGSTSISKYVNFSLSENINKIDAYINSKHISGEVDSMGREKPFFNIVTAAVNVWFRATDIDRKNIRVLSSNSKNIIQAFIASVFLHNWMKKANFGQFLNDWGRSLARYGSTVSKFVEKGGELRAEVIPWNRLIVDPIDFDANVKIEKLYLTPSQLRERKGYDQEVVKELIESTITRKNLDKQNQDTNNANFIEVYEVHGMLPLEKLTESEKDSETYVQQIHIVSFVASKENDGEYDDYCLYKGQEEKDPYFISHLIKEEGRTQSIGAVEHLFEAQWMMNHTVKGIKDQLDLASKLIFQTSDGSFVGQNALSNIENGDILIHSPNQPLTQIANSSHDITSLQNYGTQWKSQAQEIVSTPDALLGNSAPSGTAWRQVEALQQEAHSLFELMTENKGLAIEQMLVTYVLPFLKKKLNHKDEIVATLDLYGVDKIDAMYIKNESIIRENNRAIDQILNGELANPIDVQSQQANIKEELNNQGNQRFYSTDQISWKDELKDLEWNIDVDITGESRTDKDDLASLNTAFQTVASLQGRPMTPEEKFFFNKILEKTGSVSNVELQSIASTPAPQQPAPIGGV